MNRELITLARTLRQLAHDAGFAILSPVGPEARRRYALQYNAACGRLRKLVPCVNCVLLPADASPGRVRIAARDIATHMLLECPQ